MKRLLLVTGLVALLLAPSAALAQADDADSVLVRVNGDVETDEDLDVLVVVEGDARFGGSAEVMVMVNGTATLTGASVETLVVVGGTANLESGTTVSGDVFLIDSDLDRAQGATVGGDINRGFDPNVGRAFAFLGFVLWIGASITLILAGLAFAGVAPGGARRAGAALFGEIGPTLLGAVVVWIGLPILAVLAFITLVGIPTSLALFLVVLPVLGVLGYLVSGIRLGEMMLGRTREPRGHPYLAALLGVAVLQIVGWIPVLGPLVGFLAAVLGAGALAVIGWRALRTTEEAAA